jgi:hypothetical protein
MQPPLVEYSHRHQHSTATSNLHTLQTHTFFVSLSPHSRLTTDNSTATTRATQPPPAQHIHYWWNIPIATSAAQPLAIYAQTHSLPIHFGHPSTLIMHGKSYCYQHNLCWNTTATAGNTPTGAGATQPLAPEQHSHHQRHAHTYLNNTSMASIHAFNTLVIHITAMHPPPELCSHHWSYAATAGAMQSPPELHSHHQ